MSALFIPRVNNINVIQLCCANTLTRACAIVRLIMKALCCRSPEFRDSVTFEEFVKYVLWSRIKEPDQHWRPQYEQCLPCRIKYDYIVHFETMQDDAKNVLRQIAVGSNVTFPQADVYSPHSNSHSYLRFYDNISVSMLRRVLDYYQLDYTMLGYKIPDSIRHRIDAHNHPQWRR